MTPVLVIAEDTPDILEKLVEKFESLGWRVHAVTTGNEAYEILVRDRVDLVLSDIRMPEGTGIELLRRTRRMRIAGETPPPVIIMTGMLGEGENYLRALGAADVLVKPFPMREVVETAYRIIGRKVPQAC